MKIQIYTKTLDECREILEIVVDGELEASFIDGEAEDNSLSRNFNDCYSIQVLMKKAYQAGKNGEEFNLELIEGKSFLVDE